MRKPQNYILAGLIALAILAAAAPITCAQTFDDVQAAILKSDLKGAVAAAKADAAANASDAAAQQVYGIMLMANGDPKSAEAAFTDAIQQGDALDPTPTGLEKLDYDGSILHIALNRQNVTVALDAGGASAYNNRAAARIVLGHIEDGLSDLDEAMRRRPKWGKPSANAAVAWLDSNSPRKAKQFANQALKFNESTAKVYTSLAVAQMHEQLWKDADEAFKEAEDRDRSYPYELYERAAWFDSQDMTRDEQRALFQAIALDSRIADEDQWGPKNRYSTGTGSSQDDYEHVFNRGRLSGTAFQSSNQRDRGQAEDRGNSYQRRDFSETILGGGHGLNRTGLFLNFLNDNGGRPGGIDQFSIPDATYGFRRTNLSLFQNFVSSRGTEMMFETFYRYNNVTERSSSTATPFDPLTDNEYGLEFRYQMPFRQKDRIYFGYAWMLDNRTLGLPPAGDPLSGPSFVSPIEPNEQVLPAGANKLQTAFVINQHPASSTVNTAYGPIAGANGKSVFVLPYIDVHWTKSPHLAYRFAALPRLMNANADLLPIWSISDPIADVPVSSYAVQTSDFNQNPFIQGPDGRVLSLEISQSQLLGNLSYLTTTAFHRDFHDVDVLSQDPTVSPTLLLTHLPNGSSTGISVDYTQPLPGGLSLNLGTTLQTSTGSLPLPGAPSLGSLPYVPKITNTLGLGYSQGSWQVVLHTIHIGARTSVEQAPLPIGIGAICGLCSYQVATTAPMTIVYATIIHHLANGQEIVFDFQPANTTGYYFNYPTKPSLTVGYNYHY